MFNEKRIKSIIIISLVLIEAFVWTINGPNIALSLGDPDGPPPYLNSKPEQVQDEKPPKENSGQNDDGDKQQDGVNQETLKEAQEKGLLILVNKQHPIDQTYKPDDLVLIKYYAPDRSKTTRYMRAEAADSFHQLVDKAASENIELKMTTAYRSYDFQKILFDSYVKKEGEEAANKYSAKPGQSEHQTGLSVDVSSPSAGYQLSDDYGETKEGAWLAEHCHEFGFIIRFPKGKEEITGYQYEPWHIRYVGIAAAKEIYEKNLTLEEFLQDKNID
jgi:D-alanyl-D-alanine carboxypeptidase